MIKKNNIYILLCIFFYTKALFCFYEDLPILEYLTECTDQKCTEIDHYELNFTISKLFKIWHCIDFMQSIQCSIPQNDIIYLYLINDLLEAFYYIDNHTDIIKFHLIENIILNETLIHIQNHNIILHTPIFKYLMHYINTKKYIKINIHA